MTRSFIDSNILVYTFDHGDAFRRERSIALLNQGDQVNRPVISTQVLQEFFWNVTRKLRPPLPVSEAQNALDSFLKFDVVQVDVEIIRAATARLDKTSISFWDALIVEAALSAKADILYTEDLNHGQVIDGLRIVNPFLAEASAINS